MFHWAVPQGSMSHLQMVTPAEARRLSGEKQVARASGLVLLEDKPSGKGTCLQVLTFTVPGVILASEKQHTALLESCLYFLTSCLL